MESSGNKNQATTVFVLGLLGIVFCQLCAPIAWIMGNNYIRDCHMEGIEPDGLGVAGRILGMVGTLILALTFGFVFLYVGFIFMLVAAGAF